MGTDGAASGAEKALDGTSFSSGWASEQRRKALDRSLPKRNWVVSLVVGTLPALLALRLLIASRLLRGLKLLHGLLKAAHDAFECGNLRGGVVQLISGVERVLGHEPLQKIDVALKAPRSLVQAGGFRAVLYPGDILRAPRLRFRRRSGSGPTLRF